MQIIGKVLKVGETQQVSEKFRKRELWIELDQKYDNLLSVQFTQDGCDKLNVINPGDEVTIKINLGGRRWTGSDGIEKIYNSITGWDVELTKPDKPVKVDPMEPFTPDDEDDDLFG